jgi:aspartate racemase
MTRHPRPMWGVIGGMGPLVSAEFMKTVYEGRPHDTEQELPRVLLFSDPTMPDRTAALANPGAARDLAWRLERSLRAVAAAGATRLAICCVTIHAVISTLPADLRAALTSLVDLAIAAIGASNARHVVLCTTGSRRTGVFEAHPQWEGVMSRAVFPPADQQRAVHDMIYDLKAGHLGAASMSRHRRTIVRALEASGAEGYVAGCTELHLVAKRFRDLPCIDPLGILADLMQEPVAPWGRGEATADPAMSGAAGAGGQP